MLATNTYCSGNHGNHSHPTLDLGKSYSRFTPLFLAWHKSSPPPPSCVAWERVGKRWKATLHQNKWNCKPNEHAKPTSVFLFHTKKFCFVKREWFRMYWPRLLFKDFGWDMIKSIKEISIVSNKTMLIMWLKKIFSLTLLLWKTGSLDWITCATAQGMDQ